jgi:hypothetical protein
VAVAVDACSCVATALAATVGAGLDGISVLAATVDAGLGADGCVGSELSGAVAVVRADPGLGVLPAGAGPVLVGSSVVVAVGGGGRIGSVAVGVGVLVESNPRNEVPSLPTSWLSPTIRRAAPAMSRNKARNRRQRPAETVFTVRVSDRAGAPGRVL